MDEDDGGKEENVVGLCLDGVIVSLTCARAIGVWSGTEMDFIDFCFGSHHQVNYRRCGTSRMDFLLSCLVCYIQTALLVLLTSPSDHGTTIIPLLASQSLVHARIVLKFPIPAYQSPGSRRFSCSISKVGRQVPVWSYCTAYCLTCHCSFLFELIMSSSSRTGKQSLMSSSSLKWDFWLKLLHKVCTVTVLLAEGYRKLPEAT